MQAAQVYVASSSVVWSWYQGTVNSGWRPFPVCNPMERHEFTAMPTNMYDGSVISRMVGNGHAIRRSKALMVVSRSGGCAAPAQTSADIVSTKNWKTVSSFAYLRHAVTITAQKRIGPDL